MDKEMELIATVKANGIQPTYKYRSKTTGLEVNHFDMESPVIRCEIIVATPPENESCEISALQNMIFCGSEDYPYNGFLTSLAKKYCTSLPYGFCTHDHTCYTLRTMGSAGFRAFLPVFLDHIFHPLLSDAAFATEIHHIDGKCEDGGKLYLEILEDNQVNDWAEAMRRIFRDGSGYSFEFLDFPADKLRDKCSVEQTRAYHKKYYNPKNICLTVAGGIQREELFQAIEPVISKLKSKGQVPTSWERPWLRDLSELCNAEETVIFPTDDSTESPMVVVRFNGLSSLKYEIEKLAIQLLIEYLSVDFRVGTSPLTRQFVEESNLVKCGVFHADVGSNRANLTLDFLGVEMQNFQLIPQLLRKALTQEAENFDMDRMNTIVLKLYNIELSILEDFSEHSESVMQACAEHFLYAEDLDNVEEFETILNKLSNLKGLLNKPKEFWTERIHSMFLNRTWTVINTVPSKELYKERQAIDEMKLKERKEKLSSDDLLKYNLALIDANDEMNKPIPFNVFDSSLEPESWGISQLALNRVRRINPEEIIDAKAFHGNFYFDEISSNFVSITIMFDTSSLNVEDRKYLPLHRKILAKPEILTECEGENLVKQNEVEAELEKNFMEYYWAVGLDQIRRDELYCGSSCAYLLGLHAKVKLENLEDAFVWLKKLLCQVNFSRSRVLEASDELFKELKSNEDLAGGMVKSILRSILYTENTNVRQMSKFNQMNFLETLVSGKCEPTIESLEKIKTLIHDRSKVAVHIAASFSKIKEMYKEQMPNGFWPGKWMDTFQFDGNDSTTGIKIIPDSEWLQNKNVDSGLDPIQRIMVKKIDESFFAQMTPTIADANHQDIPALLIAIQYLCENTENEGPLYQHMSKEELGYLRISLHPNEGMLHLTLECSTDLVAAYESCKRILYQLINEEISWQNELLLAAKKSLILKIFDMFDSPIKTAREIFNLEFLSLPRNYHEQMIAKISQVTLKDVKLAAATWLQDLFTSPYRSCLILCPEEQVSHITESFHAFGLNLKKMDQDDTLSM